MLAIVVLCSSLSNFFSVDVVHCVGLVNGQWPGQYVL